MRDVEMYILVVIKFNCNNNSAPKISAVVTLVVVHKAYFLNRVLNFQFKSLQLIVERNFYHYYLLLIDLIMFDIY